MAFHTTKYITSLQELKDGHEAKDIQLKITLQSSKGRQSLLCQASLAAGKPHHLSINNLKQNLKQLYEKNPIKAFANRTCLPRTIFALVDFCGHPASLPDGGVRYKVKFYLEEYDSKKKVPNCLTDTSKRPLEEVSELEFYCSKTYVKWKEEQIRITLPTTMFSAAKKNSYPFCRVRLCWSFWHVRQDTEGKESELFQNVLSYSINILDAPEASSEEAKNQNSDSRCITSNADLREPSRPSQEPREPLHASDEPKKKRRKKHVSPVAESSPSGNRLQSSVDANMSTLNSTSSSQERKQELGQLLKEQELELAEAEAELEKQIEGLRAEHALKVKAIKAKYATLFQKLE